MIRVLDDANALAHAAARCFVDKARKAVALRGRFVVSLAGGQTPRQTYEWLAKSPYRTLVPWGKVHFFWGDERCVSWDDPRSNYGVARQVMLDHLPLQPAQIHPMRVDIAPEQAAKGYEGELKTFFAGETPCFDLVLLGVGEDGHTASLFPGSSALSETRRWTAIVQRPEESFSRVTLTLPILNQAHHVLFLVTGENKADIFRRMAAGLEEAGRYPAQQVRPEKGDVTWLVDRAAY